MEGREVPRIEVPNVFDPATLTPWSVNVNSGPLVRRAAILSIETTSHSWPPSS